jgi:hypothetical protein
VNTEGETPDGMAQSVRRTRDRRQRWQAEGEPSMAQFVGQIGVLGWIIVAPTLIACSQGDGSTIDSAPASSGARPY